MGETIIQKIIRTHKTRRLSGADGELVPGEFVLVKPRHILTHNNSSAVISKFKALGLDRVKDAKQPVIVLDHASPAPTEKTSQAMKSVRHFAMKQALPYFYDLERGVCHQVLIEEGFVLPGSLILGSDSHTTMHGALCAAGIPVVRTDAAALWASGETWLKVPETIKIRLQGIPDTSRICGKDIILYLIGSLGVDFALNRVVEYHGEAIEYLSMSDRMTISNMTVEMGGMAGIFPYDETAERYIRSLGQMGMLEDASIESLAPDDDARYAAIVSVNLDDLGPLVAAPHSPGNTRLIKDLAGTKISIDQAVLGSCTNGRLEDLAEAAQIVKGNKIAKGVRFIVIPASSRIYLEAIKAGYIADLIGAGATICNPNCGPCLGQHQGVLAAGESAISTTNRNFRGRMGSREANIYLASPKTVAYSALSGYINNPQAKTADRIEQPGIEVLERPKPAFARRGLSVDRIISGRLIYLTADNIDTDGIYAGKHTYISHSPEQMASLAMENYHPGFKDLVRKGCILAAGKNFGCGSSREQAATALIHAGVAAIVAESISDTYYRNAINNGFLCIECPELIDHLRKKNASITDKTIDTGEIIEIDLCASSIRFGDRRFDFEPIPLLMMEIIDCGGLLEYVKKGLRLEA